MKLRTPDAVAATARSPIIWFLGICLAASLTIISASAAVPQTGAEGLNPAEEWVVAQVTAGDIANLDTALNADHTKKFPTESDRQLSAHFLENLLMGTLFGVTLHRHGVQIKGACIDEPIDLENARIPREAHLDNCIFKEPVDFRGADIASNFSARGAKFQNKENSSTGVFVAISKGALFSKMKVGGDAFFDHAVFEGPASFFGTDIAGNFNAEAAKFQKSASFAMKVGGSASFSNAVFEGPVQFIWTDIAGDFNAVSAKFQNKYMAMFARMKVRGSVNCRKASFEGQTSFGVADIAGDFLAEEAKFHGKVAYFSRMKVGGDVSLDSTVFKGFVDFQGAEIAGNFRARTKEFHGGANFGNLKVGGEASFSAAVFQGPVSFLGADITGNFKADNGEFQHPSFRGMKVRGDALFNKAVFKGPVDLRYADFGLLDVSGASWPKVPVQFQMQGMSYKTILAAPKEPESHKALVQLADQAAYSADVYSRLEELFLRQGYRADADEAFTAGKVRERKEYFRSGDWLGWLRSWMLCLLVGYGRRPWQAGIPCAVLVALGCVLFSPKKMEPQQPEDTPRVYNRFWYSLGLFLPFVDLQSNKVWKPKADQTFLRNYMRVHILLGWILVPLVLAAVTGLIK